jgi:hypothetical protein
MAVLVRRVGGEKRRGEKKSKERAREQKGRTIPQGVWDWKKMNI